MHDHLAQLGEEHLIASDNAQCTCRFSARHSGPGHLQGSDSEAVRDILLAVAGILLNPSPFSFVG